MGDPRVSSRPHHAIERVPERVAAAIGGGARTETHFRLMDVMDPASQPNVVESGLPAARERLYVMKLEPAAFGAAPAVVRDEGASAVIATPDFAFDLRRDMPGV